MHPTKRTRRWAWWGAVLASLMAAAPALAQEQPAPTAKVDRSGAVVVPLNGSLRIGMKSGKRIKAVFNQFPNVIDILPDATDPRFVILFGRGVGASRLELTDVDGAKEEFSILVQPDIELLRALIRRAVPTASVEAIPGIGNTIILTGNVPRAEDADTILRIAASVSGNVVNGMQVGGVHQVQLDVTVARVDRTKARNRGFNFIVNGTTVSAGSVLGGLTTAGSGGGGAAASAGGVGIIPAAASAQPTNAVNLVFGVIPAQFQGLLQALKTEGLAKLLAEPKLVTQSGRPARFLAGGQQATLGAASGINGPGVVYQDIGTELEFLPIVYGNGKIYLEVNPRVIGVNQGLGIVTSFGAVPGFDRQEVRTSIVLESGQTFAIGGLIQTTVQSSIAKVPVLGEVPFIGAAFSVISQTEQETELVILVTPHIVDAMDCRQVPSRVPGAETRKPDDFELYLESLMEAPRGPRNVFENKRYKGAWKNDPTAAEYPCNEATYGRSGADCKKGIGILGHKAQGAPHHLPATVNQAPAIVNDAPATVNEAPATPTPNTAATPANPNEAVDVLPVMPPATRPIPAPVREPSLQ